MGDDTFDSINEPGKSRQSFTPPSINEPPQMPDLPAPLLASLDPDRAAIGSEDLTLEVHGANFFAGSVIFFAGHDEPTTFDEEAGTVSTIVKPSLWQNPATVQCQVHNGEQMSNALDFVFEAPPEAHAAATHTVDPDELDEEIEEAREEDEFVSTHKPHHRKRKK